MAKKSDRPRDMANDIIGAIRAGTSKWTKTRKTEERSPASRRYRYSRMTRERGVSLKEAAAEIMPDAYDKVSGNGSLPANARQIMYAARGHIQKVTGQELNSNYFTQNLLPNYVMETGVVWDVVYDARGHFNEPHADTASESAPWRFVIISRDSMNLTSARLALAKPRRRSSARAETSVRCCLSRRRVLRRCSGRRGLPRDSISPSCQPRE